ncbi:MAG: protease modulator HflK [Planctomycetota bacterium]|nr:protease modulator HflK [Planctomycetota bacterium]
MKRGSLQRPSQVREVTGAEWARMASPLLGLVGFVLRVYHWPILVLLVLYAVSGLTSVQPGQVALVLRMGRLVGDSPGQQVHESGFLFALPAPIDEVLRVDVEKVHSVRVADLASGLGREQDAMGGPLTSSRGFSRRDTINPEQDGYCLTGDDNVLQAVLLARYRVSDPIRYALEIEDPDALMRDAVCTAMVTSAGTMAIEEMMAEGRFTLSGMVRERAQALLDAADAGMELVAVEFERLSPPFQVLPAFREVVSSMIDAVTLIEEAREYGAIEVPAAMARSTTRISQARAEAAQRLGRARGESDAFEALLAEYLQNPEVVRVRLYRESIERALSPVTKRFVPPPVGERYENLRITIPF